MSVTSVTELFLERGGKADEEKTQVSRVFHVFTDDINDGPLSVMFADDIPKIHEDHPEDSGLWVVGLDPKPDTDGNHWKVTVEYGQKPGDQGGVQPGMIEPWELDPVIRFSFMSNQVVMEKCYHTVSLIDTPPAGAVRGKRLQRVTNSAGQPFDPPAMTEEHYLLISIQRAVRHTNFDPDDLRKYQYTINSNGAEIGVVSSFKVGGVPINKYCALCRDFKSDKSWTPSGQAYWQQNIEILIKEDNWIKKLVDMGRFTAALPSGATSEVPYIYTPINDTEGNAVPEPVMLDGGGGRLGNAQDPAIIFCHDIWEEDWSAWDLPSDY